MKARSKRELIEAFEKRAVHSAEQDPADKAFVGFKGLIKEALNDPYKALVMARDPFLPEWLHAFAREISTTDDDGVPLRPRLRSLVAQALENDEISCSFCSTALASTLYV